jgi:general secretion pathway protein A
MVEVGWDSGQEADATVVRGRVPSAPPVAEPDPADPPSSALPEPVGAGSEEPVDDHYAALQAWTEWARNQGRETVRADRADDDADEPAEASDPPAPTPAGVWAERQQGFAPYSQLFTRLRQPRDPR